MQILIVEETPKVLPDYGKVPMAFRVETVFRVDLIENGLGGFALTEEPVSKPFVKDYDDYEKPSEWAERFDLSNWGILSAFDGGKRVGGAVIAWNTPAVFMLEGEVTLACLWDLRVAPEHRGRGVGKLLFEKAVDWAKSRNCRLLKIETQNVNVPACRFYERRGCRLGGFNLHAYPEEMKEIALFWYRKL
ncbi:MAG TPA: GNAT family N-acetyltransferase [Pyrinomonadaceae bacterium]